MTQSQSAEVVNLLSERELEILHLVAQGASNKEIAAQLYISPNTVKVHLRNIYGKIGVSSRTEASMWAVRQGLIVVPQSLAEAGSSYADAASSLNQEVAPLASLPGRKGTLALLTLVILSFLVVVGGIRWWSPASALFAKQSVAPTPLAGAPHWVRLADMPTPRASPAVVTYQGYLFVIGGRSLEALSSAFERYDPTTNQWVVLPDKPSPVSHAQAAALDGKIYVPGGRGSDGEPLDRVEVYDIEKQQWYTTLSLPRPLSDYALTAFEGRLYLFGGWDGEQASDVVLRYAPDQEQWQVVGRLARPLVGGDAVVTDAGIFLGGFAPEGSWWYGVYRLSGEEQEPWNAQGKLSVADFHLISVSDLLFGVALSDQGSAVLQYVPAERGWSQVNISLPLSDWYEMDMAGLASKIYVIGGRNEIGQPVPYSYAYQVVYSVVIPLIQK